MPGLLIEKLCKTFAEGGSRRTDALKDVTLNIAPGELLVMVGPSGAGKTTLLRMIAGLDEPSSGTITIDGRVVNSVPPADREVAMVFQEHALYPHLNVQENLALGLKLRKFPRSEVDARVNEAAEFLGLAALFNRMPKALSGGERQRVALGRSLVLRPKVFLLDEPLSNLDAPLRAQMRRELLKLQQRLGITTLYVTHDQGEAIGLASRLAVLKDGALQQVGTPLEVYRHPANLFVGSFIGDPPLNLFTGNVTREKDRLWFTAKGPTESRKPSFPLETAGSPIAAADIGRPLIMGFRPEDTRPEGAPALEAVVESFECLGPETRLYLNWSGFEFVARFSTAFSAKIGDTVRVGIKADKVHWFDPNSGQAIH